MLMNSRKQGRPHRDDVALAHRLNLSCDSLAGATHVSSAFFMVVVLATSSCFTAKAVDLFALDSGFVTAAGGSSKGDGTIVSAATYNYSVGYELHYSTGALFAPLAAMDRNNYFLFDLSSLGAPIATASLKLPAGMLESVDGMEVYNVVAPIAPGMAIGDMMTLKTANTMGPTFFDSPADPAVGVAMALYGNIEGGAGSPLAAYAFTPADDFSTVTIPLSPGGVAYLNGFLGGPVALGGSVPTIVTGSGTPQQPFGFTAPMIPGMDPSVPVLSVTLVPEPATYALAAVGLVGLAPFVVRQRRLRSKRQLTASDAT